MKLHWHFKLGRLKLNMNWLKVSSLRLLQRRAR